MPTRKIYHVVPHPSGWAVKVGKARRASTVTKTKDAALHAASDLAKSAPKSQVVIRKSTGTINEGRTFEYRDYKKKKKVRTAVSKTRKTKLRNLRSAQRARLGRRKAALLGIARQKRAKATRRAVAKKAARKR